MQEGRFPFGKRRRHFEVMGQKMQASAISSVEAAERIYNVLDSKADSPGDTNLGTSFFDTFRSVLPDGTESLTSYIEQVLKAKRGRALAIEFGGTGSKLFANFSPRFFARTCGVTLVDHSRPKSNLEKIRANLGLSGSREHSVLLGDMFADETYNTVRQWSKGAKVDLIIERLLKGLEFVPIEPFILSKVLQRWYEMLDVNGVMLIEVPPKLDPLVESWTNLLREKRIYEKLNIEYVTASARQSSFSSVLRLRKLSGAPESLPLLDAREVRGLSKVA